MRDWLRRVDPAFYHKEPYLLRTWAQIARYTDDEQVEARLSVLRADRVMRAAVALVALAAYAVATVAGAHDPRAAWQTLWAFAVLAVAGPRALPWWPQDDGGATWRQALVGIALIAIPALWTHAADRALLGTALLVGATLYVAHGRGRIALLALAVGVVVGARMPTHPLVVAPLAGVLAAGAAVLGVTMIALESRRRPQVVTWSALAIVLAACAYAFAFNAPTVTPRVPVEIAAIAVAYLGVCVAAGRIRRAELLVRPGGVLTLPQSIVPRLDRSHDHAVICFRRE